MGQILHLPTQSVNLAKQFFPQFNSSLISVLLAGTGFATFFYKDSPPLEIVRHLVIASEHLCFWSFNKVVASCIHALPYSWEFLACLPVAFVAASLVALTRFPDRQRLLSIALGTVCIGLLFTHQVANMHLGWGLCAGWLLANLCLGRFAVYVNLVIYDLMCWAILWQFAEPHREGFQQAENLAASLGLPWIGWPIGVLVALLIGSITTWGTRKGFGTAEAAAIHHRTYR